MSVYVDDADLAFGRMTMSHMMADSHEELMAMADLIGLNRRWLQHEGQGPTREHFDVTVGKRSMAVAYGAVAMSARELAKWRIATRKNTASERRADAPD